jgi:hypothetical protein
MASREHEKRTKKLSANASQDEIDAYYAACDRADVEPSDTLRKLAKALVVHVGKHGRISFPIRIEDRNGR